MPLFSLKKIGELADGRQAYLKGTSLNSSGKVLVIAPGWQTRCLTSI